MPRGAPAHKNKETRPKRPALTHKRPRSDPSHSHQAQNSRFFEASIWYRGEKIRIADLDTPEVTSPGCANEAAMGRKATLRLQALLNEGPFTLAPDPDGEATDKYGRSLKLVTRGGESIGAMLVREGLAEEWGGPRKRWC